MLLKLRLPINRDRTSKTLKIISLFKINRASEKTRRFHSILSIFLCLVDFFVIRMQAVTNKVEYLFHVYQAFLTFQRVICVVMF